jgi:hypothetical protein
MKQWEVLALILHENGWTGDAVQLPEEVVKLQKSNLRDDQPDILSLIYNLAIEYSAIGRQVEAPRLTEEVVKLRKRKLGDTHPDTLSSIHNLAIHYGKARRQVGALQLAQEVVELRKNKLR